MTPEPGAEQDRAAVIKYADRVRRKHRLQRFAPPSASCECGGWQLSAPEGGLTFQRDLLLDGFLEHRRYMKSERLRLRDAGAL